MEIIKRYHVFSILVVVSALLVLSACSSITIGAQSSSLTPLQVLQNSANAMKQLKTAHIEMQSNSSLQVDNGNSATPMPGSSSTPTATGTPTNFNATIKGSGDIALPDQEQLKLTVNQNTNLAEIAQGSKIYVQNAQGKWFVLDKSRFQGLVGNPFSGVQLDQTSLLSLVQHTQITDHGSESLNGQNLRHITANLDKDALRQLFENNPQLKGTLGQQVTGNILDRTRSFTSSLDVWIDESQFYVHRTELKLNLTANTSGTGANAPNSATTNLDTIIDLSKFNEPVTITIPGGATPTDDPGTIFQS